MRTLFQFGLSLAAAAVLAAPVSLAQPPSPQPPAAAPRVRAAGVPIPVQTVTYLGVAGETLDPARRQALKVKDRGVLVTQVLEGTPAEKAGLKLGDVILEYNGHSVESWEQFRGLIQDSASGKTVKILISRNGGEQTLTAVPITHRVVMMSGDEMPMPMIGMAPPAHAIPMMPEVPRLQTVIASTPLGILGEELADEPQFAEYFGVKDGVLIKNVVSGSLSEKAGMKAGDVLVRFDENRIATARDLQRALRAETKSSFPVTIMRNRKEMVLTLNP